jgi:tetratricopeptide (TPR) repeat protein
VSIDDFERFSVSESESAGVLMKFHGTVDLEKAGLAKYESVRFLLDQVGEGMSTGMHQVLGQVCKKYDMVYLGYSGCDNFSVQPILCNTESDQITLWMWYEWREHMVLENSKEVYEEEMKRIGTLVSEGKSFNDINRGMETLSTCEILTTKNSLRLRGKVSEIMHACALPNDDVIAEAVKAEGPVPEWTKSISDVDRVRCAANLYSKASCTDEGIQFLEKASNLASKKVDKYLKAQIFQELGGEYSKASTSESYEKALVSFDKALQLYDDMGNINRAMETKLDKVNVYRRTRRFDEAEALLDEIQVSSDDSDLDTHLLKIRIRKGLMKGLILGMGRRDKESREEAIKVLQEVANLEAGFVGLQAAILNASGLIKYQMAGESTDILESGAKDLESAFRLNIYIGDARSCFQQMRNLGLIHAKLSRILSEPDLLEKAIEDFKRGEKFLFRLSKNRIMGELLEIRFRLGESLVAAGRFSEAEPILSKVCNERVKLGDWHNEARTLELLLKCVSNDPDELLKRTLQIKDIYEDAVTNETKRNRFLRVPITASNGKQILHTASELIEGEDASLSMELQKLSNHLFEV